MHQYSVKIIKEKYYIIYEYSTDILLYEGVIKYPNEKVLYIFLP